MDNSWDGPERRTTPHDNLQDYKINELHRRINDSETRITTHIDDKFDGHMRQEEQWMKSISALIHKHDSDLHGDGSDDKPGLVKKVDRIETKAATFKWLAGLGGGGGLSAFLAQFFGGKG